MDEGIMEDFDIYLELKASHYEGCDLTEEDWLGGTAEFGSWRAYHQAHVGATAALLIPEDAEFVKELLEIGITNCLHRRDELVATDGCPSEREEYHEYKYNVKEYVVEITQESGASPWSVMSIGEREEPPNRVILEVLVKSEEKGAKIDTHIKLAHHTRVGRAAEVSWKHQPRFLAALRMSEGQVYVTQDGVEVARDAPGGQQLSYRFATRRHSRYCEIAHGDVEYPGGSCGANQLGVALEEIVCRSETVKFEVEMLAHVQRCCCLDWFDIGKEADPRAEIGLTVEYGGDVTHGRKGLHFRNAINRTLLKEALYGNLTWWLRLFANYLRCGARGQRSMTRPIVLKIREEGHLVREPNPPAGPELYDGGDGDSRARRARDARRQAKTSREEGEREGEAQRAEGGSRRNPRRNRGRKREKKFVRVRRIGADGAVFWERQERKQPGN